MHPTARSAEINDIFIYRINFIYRTHHPQVFLEQSWIDIHIVIDYKNDHDDWLQNNDWLHDNLMTDSHWLQNNDWLQNIDWLQNNGWLQNVDWLHIWWIDDRL